MRADDYDVTAVTLPGLDSADADRSAITMSDHVDAICEAVSAAGAPVVLAVHSGAGACGYGASDRIPERIAAMVYVDSGPATGALDPDLSAVEVPLPTWEELEADPGNSLEGLTAEQLETFRRRAVPEPGAVSREAPVLTNDARLDVPSTVVCPALSSEQVKGAVEKVSRGSGVSPSCATTRPSTFSRASSWWTWTASSIASAKAASSCPARCPARVPRRLRDRARARPADLHPGNSRSASHLEAGGPSSKSFRWQPSLRLVFVDESAEEVAAV